jgi:hypothetical protein
MTYSITSGGKSRATQAALKRLVRYVSGGIFDDSPAVAVIIVLSL